MHTHTQARREAYTLKYFLKNGNPLCRFRLKVEAGSEKAEAKGIPGGPVPPQKLLLCRIMCTCVCMRMESPPSPLGLFFVSL